MVLFHSFLYVYLLKIVIFHSFLYVDQAGYVLQPGLEPISPSKSGDLNGLRQKWARGARGLRIWMTTGDGSELILIISYD